MQPVLQGEDPVRTPESSVLEWRMKCSAQNERSSCSPQLKKTNQLLGSWSVTSLKEEAVTLKTRTERRKYICSFKRMVLFSLFVSPLVFFLLQLSMTFTWPNLQLWRHKQFVTTFRTASTDLPYWGTNLLVFLKHLVNNIMLWSRMVLASFLTLDSYCDLYFVYWNVLL